MIGRTTAAVAVLGAALAGCGPGVDGETGSGQEEVVAHTAPAPLAAELLADLKSRYPVLGEERAPEPQPRGTVAPGELPERLHGQVNGTVLQTVRGGATFYADRFEGQRTASGIPFRQNQMVAAHRGFPFGTVLRVTNVENGRQVNVRVVDRGPFGAGAKAERTIIDLSRRAASELGYIDQGRTEVRVEVLEWGDGLQT